MADTNSVRFVSPRAAQFARANPFCRFFFQGVQLAGDLNDSMGGPAALKFDASFTDAEAWEANQGFATTGSSITDYFTRAPHASHDFSLAGNAMVFAGRIKKATPGSTEIVMGSFSSGSVNGGFQLTANSSGALQLAVSPVDGSGNQTASISAGVILDGAEHSFLYLFPPDTVSVKQAVDGVAVSTSGSGNASGKNCAGGNILNIGASRAGSAKVCQFADLQLYVVPTNLGSAIRFDAIAAFMHRNRGTPIPTWMFGVS